MLCVAPRSVFLSWCSRRIRCVPRAYTAPRCAAHHQRPQAGLRVRSPRRCGGVLCCHLGLYYLIFSRGRASLCGIGDHNKYYPMDHPLSDTDAATLLCILEPNMAIVCIYLNTPPSSGAVYWHRLTEEYMHNEVLPRGLGSQS